MPNEDRSIEHLIIEIESKTAKATKNMEKLLAITERLNKAIHAGGFEKLQAQMDKIASKDVSKNKNLGGSLNKAQSHAKHLAGAIGEAEVKIARLGDNYAKVEQVAKRAAEAQKKINANIPTSVKGNLTTDTLAGDTSVATVEAGRLQRVWSYITGHFKSAVRGADELAEKTEKAAKSAGRVRSQTSAIKTILLYSGLFSMVSAITNGITEGVQNVALASGKANDVLSKYSTINNQLSNSIGSALIPVLQAAYPLYSALANVVIDLADSVNILAATWNGEKQFYKANAVAKDYAQTLNKIKGVMTGFDEINVLTFSGQSSPDETGEYVEITPFDVTDAVRKIGMVTMAFVGLKLVIGSLNIGEFFRGLGKEVDSAFGGLKLKLGGLLLVAAGVGSIISGFKDFKENGPTLKNTLYLVGGITTAFIGLALVIGNPWLILVGAIAGAVVAIGMWGDEISSAIKGARSKIDTFTSNIRDKVTGFFDFWSGKCETFCPPLAKAIDIGKHIFTDGFDFLTDTLDTFLMTFEFFSSTLGMVFEGDFKGAWNNIKSYWGEFWRSWANIALSPLNWVVQRVEDALNFVGSGVSWISGGKWGWDIDIPDLQFDIPAYASGGFPEDGLFMANHNEFIGSFNGRTAVANNEMIVEGIADGVRDAQSAQNDLIREQNELLRQLLRKSGGTIPVSTIRRALDRQNKRAGRVVVPVGT